MNVMITLQTDNAAFDEWGEVGRVIDRAKDALDRRGLESEWGEMLRDSNGNVVGAVTVAVSKSAGKRLKAGLSGPKD